MASRAFTSSLRATLRRTALNRVAAPSCKRFNSTHAPSGRSSDTPWIIGSAVVFGPLFLYLLAPDGKKDHHHDKSEHKSEPAVEEKEVETEPEPEAPAAAEESSPEPPAEAAPVAETTSESATVTDDEGTPISAEEVKESIQRAEVSDAPKEAAAEEKKEAS
ncbi:uncharacterized protein BT62DRAFT_994735 [Guyanagaster necrorhizus]|uniref:Uncharacterized protein n=1 Tax=Guyanagaster necrorhizus TaxID=856835 RepID=A0A9P7VQY6_9AGAR|nr:uncharacterized protein BT62DRAFT_994735 [Guyanagaster necrorhizus MCA 3950]KAG7445813.1 hypothetical protein BT62DRAFT_994735 [Guyanagaster necrorhizus MCA 3950]